MGVEKIRVINGDCLGVLKTLADNSIDSIVTDPPYGLSFMGKKWDYDVPSIEIWAECLRVLKHGGYLLAFAGTRTQHRMACRIEDAGFEIRDMIAWIYGSGFPKSHNIGKAVDEKLGNERETVGVVDGMGKQNPEWNGTATGRKENSFKPQYEASKGTSDWEGWGTALKPALEPITVARKPIEGTVADNVLKWGVGGINVDGCRVGTELVKTSNGDGFGTGGIYGTGINNNKGNESIGRFPANLIHDGSEEVVALFPNTKSGGGKKCDKDKSNTNYGIYGVCKPTETKLYEADEGSAARFFYCAKASKGERNFGLDGFEENMPQHDFGTKLGVKRSERIHTPTKNFHPTVKPIALMRYLCRLVTPKGGTVLDPFTGSGTTGIAAKLEGFNFIGIEREVDYVKIAEARISHWQDDAPVNDNQLTLNI